MMKIKGIVTVLAGIFLGSTIMGESVVKMEKLSYGGWPNCIKLSNGKIELVATTDVGPRIIRLGFVGGQNLFKEWKDQLGKAGGKEWKCFGGHRLWHAPEVMPRTYAPDNDPIQYDWDGKILTLRQGAEPSTGIAKQIEIALDPARNKVTVTHYLINKNCWDVELALWCLTVMDEGGRAIFPQEPFQSHDVCLVPSRPLAMWYFTDMADPRWTWGTKYIQLRQDPKAKTCQKIGFLNKQGWAAYSLKGQVFIKRFDYDPAATYTDFGCNTETYTQSDMLEVESLGSLTKIAPNGQAKHIERWFLFEGDVGADEPAIDKNLLPLVKQTE
jgi:hypothetical protein